MWVTDEEEDESADDEVLVSLSAGQTLQISSPCGSVSAVWDASLSASTVRSALSLLGTLSCNNQLLLAAASKDTARVRTITLLSRLKMFFWFVTPCQECYFVFLCHLIMRVHIKIQCFLVRHAYSTHLNSLVPHKCSHMQCILHALFLF